MAATTRMPPSGSPLPGAGDRLRALAHRWFVAPLPDARGRIGRVLVPVRPGNPDRGVEMVQGRFHLAGQVVEATHKLGPDPYTPADGDAAGRGADEPDIELTPPPPVLPAPDPFLDDTALPEDAALLEGGSVAVAPPPVAAMPPPPALSRPDWLPDEASDAWLVAWQGFTWMDDLRAVAGSHASRARALARALVAEWIAADRAAFEPYAWSPGIAGRRLAAFALHAGFLIDADDDTLQAARTDDRRLMAAMRQHADRLERMVKWRGLDGVERIQALRGLWMGRAALGAGRRKLAKIAKQLALALGRQIHEDGVHRSRSPARQLELLSDLVELKAIAAAHNLNMPGEFDDAMSRLAAALRLMRHRDGVLALFNGTPEIPAAEVDAVLGQIPPRGMDRLDGRIGGFERLAARRTTVLVDLGLPAPPRAGQTGFAGFGSFEMSTGRERLVVNCGAYVARPGPWMQAVTQAAAHSGVTIDETGPVRVEAGSGDRRQRRDTPPVVVDRRDDEGAQWLEFSHHGFRDHGLVHSRRLYLGPDGDDLRGEDRFTATGADDTAAPSRFALRFHLHPAAKASPIQGGAAVLVRPVRGPGWYVRADGASIAIEDSVHMGQGGRVRAAQQIVVSGVTEGAETRIRWAFQQVQSRPEGDARVNAAATGPGFDTRPARIEDVRGAAGDARTGTAVPDAAGPPEPAALRGTRPGAGDPPASA
ncbi:hypothetical protein GCM10011505_21410 [Tistrella bauzanensis]|uniref:Heparinase II/III-like C-terminal domain-containing protein n=1 Tax=Tistrella bauzanensis TaxID=657419 RepID=A0ABQ1IHQ5_9PROT|nr:heparinase II/III family protein [Tistrella bauzanensis]GGB39570.1 hypothetical protein GCM10011505_21410 [Tistrella bauzanensis]